MLRQRETVYVSYINICQKETYEHPVTRTGKGLLGKTEMKMLLWILGVSLKDKKRNGVIRKSPEMTFIKLVKYDVLIEMARSCDEKRVLTKTL